MVVVLHLVPRDTTWQQDSVGLCVIVEKGHHICILLERQSTVGRCLLLPWRLVVRPLTMKLAFTAVNLSLPIVMGALLSNLAFLNSRLQIGKEIAGVGIMSCVYLYIPIP